MKAFRSIMIGVSMALFAFGDAAAQDDTFQVTAFFDFEEYIQLDAKQANEAALQMLERGYAQCRRSTPDPQRCEEFMQWMVPKALSTGNLVAADDYARRDIAWKRATGHEGLAISLMQLGKLLRERGDLTASEEVLDEALLEADQRKRRFLRQYPDMEVFGITVTLDGPIFYVREQLGLTLLARGEFAEAEREFVAFLDYQQRAWDILQKDMEAEGYTLSESDNVGVANGLYLIAKTQLAQGKFDEAERYFRRNFEKIGAQLFIIAAYPQVLEYLGEYSRAIVAQGSASPFARTLLLKAIEGIEMRLTSISDASRNPVGEIEAYGSVFKDQVANNWRLARD